ncbi:MAG: inositol monophosphatase [Haloferacaceae archaeon]
MDDLAARIEVLERAAREGGSIAEAAFRTDLTVEEKGHALDAVTDVDRAVQRHVVDVLSTAFPDEPIVAEEEDALKEVPAAGPAWLVDPIDGTNNFVAGTRCWATSVAAVADGEPVAAVNHFPALGDTYRTTPVGVSRNGEAVAVSDRERPAEVTAGPLYGLGRQDREAYATVTRRIVDSLGDLRRAGSSQATLSRVAAGELDAAVSTVRLPPWDTVAGVHLVRRAGGTVTDVDGEPWRHDSQGLVASNGRAHDALLELVDGV